MDEISNELQEEWKKVIKSIPKKERDGLPSKPDMRTLSRVFKEAQDKLKSKQKSDSSKVKAWFVGIAGTIQNHNYLLKLLPDGDKYTSVLVGSFTVLIQVCFPPVA